VLHGVTHVSHVELDFWSSLHTRALPVAAGIAISVEELTATWHFLVQGLAIQNFFHDHIFLHIPI
jgi:hypothetical protein